MAVECSRSVWRTSVWTKPAGNTPGPSAVAGMGARATSLLDQLQSQHRGDVWSHCRQSHHPELGYRRSGSLAKQGSPAQLLNRAWPFPKTTCHSKRCFCYVELTAKKTFLVLGWNCSQCDGFIFIFFYSMAASSFAFPFI